MNKLDSKLKEITKKGKIGLMAHVVIGYPTLEDTISLVKTMDKVGVDIVEMQIPFSDPLADGPTIMRACEKSLEQGTKVADAFVIAKILSTEVSIPLLFMCYYNTVFKYGVEKFCKDAAKAGITGLIVPDVPLDEEPYEHFIQYCKKYNVHAIRVISPATTPERLEKNAKVASGFVYCTSRQGTTGAQTTINKELSVFLKKAKNCFAVPIAVGFGISKPEHVRMLQGKADIAIVGSALLNVINSSDKKDMIKNVTNFIYSLRHPGK